MLVFGMVLISQVPKEVKAAGKVAYWDIITTTQQGGCPGKQSGDNPTWSYQTLTTRCEFYGKPETTYTVYWYVVPDPEEPYAPSWGNGNLIQKNFTTGPDEGNGYGSALISFFDITVGWGAGTLPWVVNGWSWKMTAIGPWCGANLPSETWWCNRTDGF